MAAQDVAVKEAFIDLLRNNAQKYSETLALDMGVDYFCVSDAETREIYFLSGPNFNCDQDYKGKKCHKVLWKRDKPCPGCLQQPLTQVFYTARQVALDNKRFLISRKYGTWQGKKALFEVMADITDSARADDILLDNVSQKSLTLSWLRYLAENDHFSDALEAFLPALCIYFQAQYGWIISFTQTKIKKTYSFDPSQEPPVLITPDAEDLAIWGQILDGDKQVFIRSVADMEDKTGREFLRLAGVDSLCLIPVFVRQKLMGLICLVNFTRHIDTLPFLKMLAASMTTAVRRKVLREEKFRAQFNDPLTGYLNFEGFKQEVERILQENPHRKYALFYCDLKNFKFINDVFGYETGDRLLKYWAAFIDANIQPGESFCRISADNFSLLLCYDTVLELETRFRQLNQYLVDFEDFYAKKFSVQLVTGVYLMAKANDRMALGQMINRATMAQKTVKGLSGSRLAFYTEEMRQKEVAELELLGNMKDALKNREFKLYLQPQMSLSQAAAAKTRAEVLVRWQRESGELVMPGDFVGLFEKNGVIVDLDHYMFDQACRFLDDLPKHKINSVCLTVNVSRITVFQPGFVETYCRIKNKYNIPAGCLELEFTENGIVKDVAYFAKIIAQLRENGFLCAMDDFGSGESSLNLLQSLPFNVLKLDRNFFNDSQNGPRNQIVVSCVLDMAKKLQMDTVAEGIEIEEQVRLLKSMGCDYIQGYIYASPMPAEEFRSQLLERTL